MRGRGSVIRFAVALVAIVLLGAACADEDGSDAGASGPTAADVTGTTAETTGSTGAAGDDTTGSTSDDDGGGGGRYDYGNGDGGGGNGGGGDADLSADNFAFAPDTIEVAAGTELVVENANGSTPHTFTVEGTDVDLELDPGDAEDVTIDLDPGTYTFLCRFHPQMTGTLTVV